jgi:hypothetical protein
MTIYLFHLYFVVGARVALDRWHPEPLAAVHIVLWIVAGSLGPWVVFQIFKGLPLFHWSLGLSMPKPPAGTPREAPSMGFSAPQPSGAGSAPS